MSLRVNCLERERKVICIEKPHQHLGTLLTEGRSSQTKLAICVTSSELLEARAGSNLYREVTMSKFFLLNFKRMKLYYVYILLCSDKTYYTGFTSNLETRLESHQDGKYKDSYTYKRRPVLLKFYCEFTNPQQAIDSEKQIKKWSRAKKEALISGQYEKLPNLANKNFSK